ncbi:ATP-binding protein [Aliarcobacter cryaerophilus]|uniref:ATP-binding protein n=1 Tax=Aliarcobacter cryaerophilus TaxID=28198 RepID=UPI003DA539B9
MNSTFDYEKLKLFYIGKEKIDGQITPLVYQNKDLLTHAAIIGMTGSGKTGLGITLLEEAAIDAIPSIIIDPKGDMTNLLLNFPELNPSDFEPWLDDSEVSNSGGTKEELAIKVSNSYKEGIQRDFQDLSRVKKLKDSADFTIYTPGSSAGVQVSILSSFKAPTIEILEDMELFSNIINSTVHSILSLIDNKSDETSKESILLASIFTNYFKEQKDLTLEELITLIVTPPFSKIGVFDLETFFPQSDRLKFALKINTIIASPSFSSWLEGESLDISKMLYSQSGKAKVNIFSIAHLNDSQRMFFVTILLNQILAWMRRQEGTTSLKALLYMDEIFGYFPPQANPPSKQPMLTLLKQARSFGIGVILSTQNPVDIDYKGLSNIGTWFIGRLQTKQDIEKVIDGLSSASENGLNKQELSLALGTLAKRNFIMKNINEESIKTFETRWALSYLKGPLSKDAIKKLMENKKNNSTKNLEEKNSEVNEPFIDVSKGKSKPIIVSNIKEKYSYSSQNNAYYMQGYLLFSCNVHYLYTLKNVDLKEHINFKIYLDEKASQINFDEREDVLTDTFDEKEKPNSFYYELPSFIQNEKELKLLERDFTDYVYRNFKLTLYKNDTLKISSKQYESLDDFKIRIQDRLNEQIDEKIENLKQKFEKENTLLEQKISKLFEKLKKEEQDALSATTNSIISIGTSILGAFFGKSSKTAIVSKVATSSRGVSKALKERSDIKTVQGEIDALQSLQDGLEEKLKIEIEKINDEFNISKYTIEEFFIKPKRTDIYDIKIELLWQEQ